MKQKIGIHWFRRDLRVAGNENLRTNWKVNEGRVLGLFCFDSAFLKREDFSHNRFAFFIKTLKALKAELVAQGGDLLVVDEQPAEAFKNIIQSVKNNKQFELNIVSYGKDYEPFARQRDNKIKDLLASEGIQVHSQRDHLLIEPHEILKDDGGFYQIYSPFAKRWFDFLQSNEVQNRLKQQDKISSYYKKLIQNETEEIFKIKWSDLKSIKYKDSCDSFEFENQKNVTIEIPEAGFKAGFEALTQFKKKLDSYNTNRDFPIIEGTSMLSLYQKNGSLVSSQILNQLGLQQTKWIDKHESVQYVKEIAWREFYYAILYHKSEVEKKAFLEQYQNLKWQNDKNHFQSWCDGLTGFPIVDAGMRQLNQTGWMHNRVRMIVASFLVKDLLINWQWGENYFMKQLLDGDLAPNNGGWQWAASTGCDPQPYFRIFNPWLQGEKFDAEAKYIKKYIPELKNFTAKQIHDPTFDKTAYGYPATIVNHAVQKEKAIALFKNIKK